MRHFLMSCALAATLVCFSATAPAAAVSFDWATVGNAGNAADTTTYGAVSYDYRISKTDVTNAQYVDFLNAVDPTGANAHSLYNSNMDTSTTVGGISFNPGAANGSKYTAKSAFANQPVVYVSWNSAARFVNWLSNGQGSSDTETGVYDMSQTNPARASGAAIFLPTENEWYKAAYYDPTLNGGSGGYWSYATKSNTAPTAESPTAHPASTNSANYASVMPASGRLTDVGAYANSVSYYGTFDQSGNVYNWNETLTQASPALRDTRGGGWASSSAGLVKTFRQNLSPTTTADNLGFRVATVVPEPSSAIVLLSVGGLALMKRRRRCSR